MILRNHVAWRRPVHTKEPTQVDSNSMDRNERGNRRNASSMPRDQSPTDTMASLKLSNRCKQDIFQHAPETYPDSKGATPWHMNWMRS